MIIDTLKEDLHYDLEAGLRKKLVRASIVMFTLMTTFAFAFLTQKTAAGVLTGGAIALFCFVELRRTLEKTFSFISGDNGRMKGLVIGRYYLKLIFVSLLFYLLLKGEKVNAIGLILGLSVIPATMTFAGIFLYLNNIKTTVK